MRRTMLIVLGISLFAGLSFAGLQVNPVTGKLDKAGISGLSSSGGNIGIGTSSPTEALEVVGNLVVSGSITALGSENMGIGTLLPSQKLEVVGTIRTTGLNVGIGTTVAQQLCRKSTGEIGYFNGAWASTCN